MWLINLIRTTMSGTDLKNKLLLPHVLWRIPDDGLSDSNCCETSSRDWSLFFRSHSPSRWPHLFNILGCWIQLMHQIVAKWLRPKHLCNVGHAGGLNPLYWSYSEQFNAFEPMFTITDIEIQPLPVVTQSYFLLNRCVSSLLHLKLHSQAYFIGKPTVLRLSEGPD